MKRPDQGAVNDEDRVYLNFKYGKLQESVLILGYWSNTCFCSLFWSKLKQHYESHHTQTQKVIENINYNREGKQLFSK